MQTNRYYEGLLPGSQSQLAIADEPLRELRRCTVLGYTGTEMETTVIPKTSLRYADEGMQVKGNVGVYSSGTVLVSFALLIALVPTSPSSRYITCHQGHHSLSYHLPPILRAQHSQSLLQGSRGISNRT